MSKWLMVLCFMFITSNFLFAQQNNLEIKGSGSNLYLEHVVSPKESLYSVGRTYNINPKDLASYNHLKISSGLTIGESLKIPLGKSNFVQSKKTPPGDVLIPLYHTVASGETLYRLGVNYNKVPLESIKKWNRLTSDAVNVGEPVIVGFLKVAKSQSSLANTKPAESNEVAVVSPKIEKPEVKAPEESSPKVTEQSPPSQKVAEALKTVQNETPSAPAENTKPAVTSANTPVNFSGGYFKNLFDQQAISKSSVADAGSAGIFKSTSGWQDGKYYCFNNQAAPGTILKVTNNTTGKIVFAKVLDAIPDIKQNDGLVIVISNAAAEELGATDTKFDCVITYFK